MVVCLEDVAGRIRKLHPEVQQEIRDDLRTLQRSPSQDALFRTIDVVFVGQRRNVYEEMLSLGRSPSSRN